MCGKTMPEREKYPTSVFENALLPGFFPLCVLSFGLSCHHILTMSCLLAFFSLCSSLVLGVSLSPFLAWIFLVSTAVAMSCRVVVSSLSQWEGVSLSIFILPLVTNLGPFLLSCPLCNDSHGKIQKCLGFTVRAVKPSWRNPELFVSPAEESELVMHIQAFSWII